MAKSTQQGTERYHFGRLHRLSGETAKIKTYGFIELHSLLINELTFIFSDDVSYAEVDNKALQGDALRPSYSHRCAISNPTNTVARHGVRQLRLSREPTHLHRDDRI